MIVAARSAQRGQGRNQNVGQVVACPARKLEPFVAWSRAYYFECPNRL